MGKNIAINFNPNKTIGENAEKIGVSYDAIRKYMKKHGILKHNCNFNNRLLQLKQAKENLEKQGVTPSVKELVKVLKWHKDTVKRYLNILKEYELKTGNQILPLFMLNKQEQIIKSVDTNQNKILENIIKLYVPTGEIDCDLTFSTGVFYKNKILPPTYKFDKYPANDSIKPLDEIVYLNDNSLRSVVCDPPFVIDSPYKLSSGKKRDVGTNMMVDRFNAFRTVRDLEEAYHFLIKQSHRILQKNGIFIIKCMMVLYGGKQIDSPLFVKNTCLSLGFELLDEFVLVSKSKALHGRHPIQRHSRKYHSFFLVFEKKSIK